MIGNENLELIKKHLPKDWVAKVREMVPFSESAIRLVLRGKLDNEEILSAIIKVATDNKILLDKKASELEAEINLLKS